MKILKRILVAIAIVVVVLLVVLYGGSEWMLRRSHAAPLPAIAADRSPAGLAEGERLAHVDSCTGCHRDGKGNVLADIPGVVRIAPPPIARAATAYSDAELARLIRYGVKRDGSSTFFMPSDTLSHISDDDLARIIGWVRTLRPAPDDSRATMHYGPLGRLGLLLGKLELEARTQADAPKVRPQAIGAYFVRTACLSCHDLHKDGRTEDDGRTIPALAPMAAAYDPAAFHKLLHTGIGVTPRDLGLMKRVARADLTRLSDAEIDAMQAWLKDEAERAPAQ